MNHGENQKRRGSDAQRVTNALKNGLGALISRLMIIVVLPLVSILAGYAAKVTLDNISLSIAAVAKDVGKLADDVADIKTSSRQSATQVERVQNGFTRLDERTVNIDRRLDTLEKRK